MVPKKEDYTEKEVRFQKASQIFLLIRIRSRAFFLLFADARKLVFETPSDELNPAGRVLVK